MVLQPGNAQIWKIEFADIYNTHTFYVDEFIELVSSKFLSFLLILIAWKTPKLKFLTPSK